MAPKTREGGALTKKIATLQLRLAPLVPLPSGPPHSAFPKTLMAFHLLTEDQLDSIAHRYHQSTPGPWTNHYPANMNWDKEFLAKPAEGMPFEGDLQRLGGQGIQSDEAWLKDLLRTVENLQQPMLTQQTSESPRSENPYACLTDAERIRIKRRKVGRFIGLTGMETPLDEVVGRVQAGIDRAIERSREQLRRDEEVMLRRRKMA